MNAECSLPVKRRRRRRRKVRSEKSTPPLLRDQSRVGRFCAGVQWVPSSSPTVINFKFESLNHFIQITVPPDWTRSWDIIEPMIRRKTGICCDEISVSDVTTDCKYAEFQPDKTYTLRRSPKESSFRCGRPCRWIHPRPVNMKEKRATVENNLPLLLQIRNEELIELALKSNRTWNRYEVRKADMEKQSVAKPSTIGIPRDMLRPYTEEDSTLPLDILYDQNGVRMVRT